MFIAKIKLSPVLTIEVQAVEGQNLADSQRAIIEGIAFWQGIPAQCGICQAPVIFTARHPKGFQYHGLRCQGPKAHELNFGERMDKTSLFYREDGWKEAYGGDQQEEEQSAPPARQPQRQQAAPTQARTALDRNANSAASGEKVKPAKIAELMRMFAKTNIEDKMVFIQEIINDPNVKMIKDLSEAQAEMVLEVASVM